MNKNHLFLTQLLNYQSSTYYNININYFEEQPHCFTTSQLKLENRELIYYFEDSDKEAYESFIEKIERADRFEKN